MESNYSWVNTGNSTLFLKIFMSKSFDMKKIPLDVARYHVVADLQKIGTYHEVGREDCSVKEIPLVSFGYHSCNAIALSDGNKIGLSHMGPSRHYVEGYLYDMAKDFGLDKEELKPRSHSVLEAIPICGIGMGNIKKHCKNLGIEVVNEFQDEWYYDYSDQRRFDPRHVLVFPKSREVWIYTQKGMKKRSFGKFPQNP